MPAVSRRLTRSLGGVMLGALLSCAEPAPDTSTRDVAPAPGSPPAFQLVVTSDQLGELYPCGCRVAPAGGLARRVAAIVRHAGRGPSLVVDGGDAFFRLARINPRDAAEARANAEVIADGLRRTRAAAMVVGERDLALGLDVLEGLAERAGVTLVAANLRDDQGRSPFATQVDIDVAGRRVSVIGAVGPGLGYRAAALSVSEPVAALVASARGARGRGADAVVALLHMSEGQAADVERKVGRDLVDAFVLGHPRRAAAVARQGRTLQAGDRGRWVLTASVARGRVFGVGLHPVGASDPEDPAMAAQVRRVAQRASARDRGAPRYVGAGACKRCHAPAYASWRRTAHARTWRTLAAARQTSNLDCFACHVTGFERPGGPRSVAETARLRSVGCEACHGPGSRHVASSTVAMPVAAVGPEVCQECHRSDPHQGPFDHEARRAQITGVGHGRGPKTPAPSIR